MSQQAQLHEEEQTGLGLDITRVGCLPKVSRGQPWERAEGGGGMVRIKLFMRSLSSDQWRSGGEVWFQFSTWDQTSRGSASLPWEGHVVPVASGAQEGGS